MATATHWIMRTESPCEFFIAAETRLLHSTSAETGLHIHPVRIKLILGVPKLDDEPAVHRQHAAVAEGGDVDMVDLLALFDEGLERFSEKALKLLLAH
jgi:hypothetical protein